MEVMEVTALTSVQLSGERGLIIFDCGFSFHNKCQLAKSPSLHECHLPNIDVLTNCSFSMDLKGKRKK